MPLDSYIPEGRPTRTESPSSLNAQLSKAEVLDTTINALEAECAAISKTLGTSEISNPSAETPTRSTPEKLFEDPEIVGKIDHAEIASLDVLEAAVIAETRQALRSLYESRQKLADLTTEPGSFEKNPAARSLIEGFKRLSELRSAKAEHIFYPRIGFPADGGAVEGQWVEVLDIETKDKSYSNYQVNFKLTQKHLTDLLAKIEKADLPADILHEDGQILFRPSKQMSKSPQVFAEAIVLRRGGIALQISQGIRKREVNGESHEADERCSMGLITVDIVKSEATQAASNLAQLMEDLGIKNCFGEPTKEDVTAYKTARYAWHHKQSLETMDEATQAMIDQRLVKQEVMPGYTTLVEPGKHADYIKQAGMISVYHELNLRAEDYANFFASDGLLCSRKRYEGGRLDSGGISTSEDLTSGGGDSVFTRLVTEKGLAAKPDKDDSIRSPHIVFKPSVLDRSDWYAYPVDEFGTTEESIFATRLAPATLFEQHAEGEFFPMNEQMFRHGLAREEVMAVVIPGYDQARLTAVLAIAERGLTELEGKSFDELIFMDRNDLIAHYKKHKAILGMTDQQIENTVGEDARDKIIASCKMRGIFEVNGQPIENCIRYGERLSDQIEITAQPDWHKTKYIQEWRDQFNETAKMNHDFLHSSSDEEPYAKKAA